MLAAASALPLVVLALLVARPEADARWENHPAHFWLVLVTALASVALGYAVSVAARRRRGGRLFFASLACMSAAAFLGLHALATPGVLLGKNAGFELATPVGLVIAGGFAAASGLELSPQASMRVISRTVILFALVAGAVVVWGVVSLAGLPPLDQPIALAQLDGWQVSLAVAGCILYGAAAVGYGRLYRRRRAGVLLAVCLAFVLL